MAARRPSLRHRPRGLAVMAWLRLARVHQQVERAATAHLRRWQVSAPQFDLIAHVGAAEGLTQQELAAARLTTKGNLSQLLDGLERNGLVRRVRDGNAKRVYLTDAGRRLFEEVVPDHEALITRRFCVLTPREQEQLLRLLRTLDHALKEE